MVNNSKKNKDTILHIKNIINPLIPLDNVNISGYEEILDYAIKNSKINNIAITSPYGGGKSSIIRTYESKNKNYFNINAQEFVYIPILEIDSENTDKNIIERKIVEHLANKLKMNNYKYNKLKLFKKTPLLEPIFIFISTFLIVLIITFVLLNNFTILSEINIISYFGGKYKIFAKITKLLPYIKFITTILIAFTTTYFIKNIISHGYFKNIKIGNLELNFPKDNDDKETFISINKNEVLYLLSKIKRKNRVIIFEDIDRFGETKVFNDLREINYLANVNRKDKEKLKFIYLIKDDLFKSKEQAKFFDLIIPVLPIADKSNSYEHIMNLITNYNEKAKKKLDLSKSYIMEISLYLEDMRLINNIMNEFYIYLNRLDNMSINHEKLFSIIIYKSLFPKDFEKLHLHKSFINLVFNEDKRHNTEKSIDNQDINFYKDIISRMNNKEIAKELNSNLDFIVFLLREGYINETYTDYIVDPNNYYLSPRDKKYIRSILDREYLNSDYKLDDPNTIIEIIFKRISDGNIYNHYLTKEIVSMNKNNEELKLNFFKNLKNNEKYDYVYDYFKFILNEDESFNKKNLLNDFIRLIHKDNNYFSEFPYEDIFKRYKEEVLVHALLIMSIEDLKYTLEVESKYEKFAKLIKENSVILNKLIKFEKILELDEHRQEFIENIIKSNFKFNNIDKDIDDLAFKIIYDANIYEYNKNNIDYILNKINIKTKKNRNILTDIKENKLAGNFREYTGMDNNLEVLVDYVLEISGKAKIVDEDLIAIEILNSQISIEYKREYIKKFNNDLENITELDYIEILGFLLEQEKVKLNMANLKFIFKNKKALDTDIMTRYIDKVYIIEDQLGLVDYDDLDIDIYELFLWILEITSNKRFIKNFIKLYSDIKLKKLTDINLEKVDINVIELLVNINLIEYNIDNYNLLKNNFQSCITKFAKNNIHYFLNDVKESNIISDDEILGELLGLEFEDKIKLEIVDIYSADELKIGENKLSIDLQIYIFENKLYLEDLLKFISIHKEGKNLNKSQRKKYINIIYENMTEILEKSDEVIRNWSSDFILELIVKDNTYDNKFNDGVFNLVENNIKKLNLKEPKIEEYIIKIWDNINEYSNIYKEVMGHLLNVKNHNSQINIKVLLTFFKNLDIEIEYKNKVLISQIKYYNKEEVSLLLNSCNKNKTYLSLYKVLNPMEFGLKGNNRVKIDYTESNRMILELFKKNEWIADYNLVERGTKYSIKPLPLSEPR